MGKTGILLETDNGEIKAANYGVVTAARETGDNEVVGFLMDASAESCKAAVQEYGVGSVIEIQADTGDFKVSPELQANALADAMQHYEISALLGLSGQDDGVLEQRRRTPRTAARLHAHLPPSNVPWPCREADNGR